MKKFSKIMSGALALAMAACMGTTAFAASTPADGITGDTSADVKLNATVPKPEADYYVNITWENMTFTYSNAVAASDWDSAKHVYNVEATQGQWDKNNATVKVVNNSNVPVSLNADYSTTDYESGQQNANGVTVTWTTFAVSQLGAGTEANTTPSEGDNQSTATVAVTGNPTESISSVTAGTITVTIGAVEG